MKFGSVCSGIEAASVAWKPLGWKAAWLAEIEPFPCKVLAHHYPETPNFGDMTKFKDWPTDEKHSIDLLCGGTPCQSFSVAGLRKGLDDPRGNLMLTYLAIARQYSPRWLVWENVPGVLSSNGGRDFGSFLGGLAECGYGFAYRVLDAQYFGVAQRRRRVFVVGYLGDWRLAAAVLFERHSLSGHPAPSREKGKTIATSVTTGAPFSRTGNDRVEAEAMVVWPPEVAPTIDAHFGNKQGLENQHINGGGGCLPLVSKTLLTKIRVDAETETLIPTIGGHFSCEPIALAENTIGRQPQNGGNGDGFTEGGPMYTLNATGVHGVAQPIAYAFDSLSSNSMKSANPASGCNEVDVSKALDTSRGLDPSCNQGGIGVAQPIPFRDTADCLTAAYGTKWNGNASADNGSLFVAQPIPFDTTQITSPQNGNNPKSGDPCHPLAAGAHPPAIAQPTIIHGTQDPCVSDIAFAQGRNNGGENVMVQAMAVRRLTPKECERLQGFPDNHTFIPITMRQPIEGQPCVVKMSADGPRYKALGNSMAVPVMAWIGERIKMVAA